MEEIVFKKEEKKPKNQADVNIDPALFCFWLLMALSVVFIAYDATRESEVFTGWGYVIGACFMVVMLIIGLIRHRNESARLGWGIIPDAKDIECSDRDLFSCYEIYSSSKTNFHFLASIAVFGGAPRFVFFPQACKSVMQQLDSNDLFAIKKEGGAITIVPYVKFLTAYDYCNDNIIPVPHSDTLYKKKDTSVTERGDESKVKEV